MEEETKRRKLRQLHGQVGEAFYEYARVQFAQYTLQSPAWQPPINAYRCAKCATICVDLAGVDKETINLEVESRKVMLRGRRPAPEPAGAQGAPVQVLAMEINYGEFEKEILLPFDVRTEGVTAEQKNGLLWIYLPLLSEA